MAVPQLPDGDRSFRVLVESSSDLVAVVDPKTRVIYANPAVSALLGEPLEILTQDEITRRIHPEDFPRFAQRLQAIADAPGAIAVERIRVAGVNDWRTLGVTLHNLVGEPAVQGIVLSGQDVTTHAAAERALRTLSRANEILVRAPDRATLLDDMCDTIVRSAGYNLAWVGTADDDAARTVTPIAKAGKIDYVTDIHVTWADDTHGRGPAGLAVRSNEVQVLRDVEDDPGYAPWLDRAHAFGFRSVCVLPFDFHQQRGILAIYSDELDAFDPSAVSLLKELAANLGYGLTHLHATASLNASLKATIQALAAAVELRDPFTAGHQRRVAELAAAICTGLGMDPHDTEGVVLGATIHDVGKIGVPSEILTTIALTYLEYELIKEHPQAGFEIISGIDLPWPIDRMVLQHHERLDGSGYPMGLRGPAVSLGARIIAVADVVESMASHRPYRATQGIDAAITEIHHGAGKVYDPDAVKACLAALEARDFKFWEGPRGITPKFGQAVHLRDLAD